MTLATAGTRQHWLLRDGAIDLDRPVLMGILNVTPDSFSDGGSFRSVDEALDRARLMVDEGAEILDIGGESTRPGAEPVDEASEKARVLPVIRAIKRHLSVPVSIDTRRAAVARAAIDEGAAIVNDVSALADPAMAAVVSGAGVGIVLMHMRGTPATMQNGPRYDNVVEEVADELGARLAAAERAGIDPDRIVLDPGIGFGKTADHNIALIAGLERIGRWGRPLLLGVSRKAFLGTLVGESPGRAGERNRRRLRLGIDARSAYLSRPRCSPRPRSPPRRGRIPAGPRTDQLTVLEQIGFLAPDWKDLLEILVVSAVFYRILLLLAGTRAIQMLLGLLLLSGIYFISRALNLDLMRSLLETLFEFGAIAALVVFQPELRSALAHLGQNQLWRRFFSRLEETEVAEEIAQAAEDLARAKAGAIIAIEREVGLGEYAETGSPLQARVSAPLLNTIFSPYSPLHDGAVIVRGDTIVAAGAILPLTQFPVADKSMGTRHRAALGLSEETDAIVIVVSEETSQISLASRGRMERGFDRERLAAVLAAREPGLESASLSEKERPRSGISG